MKEYIKLSLFLLIIFIIGATLTLLKKWTYTGVFNMEVYLLGIVVCFDSPAVLYGVEFISKNARKDD